jgi:hypothetical protein
VKPSVEPCFQGVCRTNYKQSSQLLPNSSSQSASAPQLVPTTTNYLFFLENPIFPLHDEE